MVRAVGRGVDVFQVSGSTRRWAEYHDRFGAVVIPEEPRDSRIRAVHRGVTLDLAPGTVLLLRPGEVHRTLEVSRPIRFVVIKVLPEVVARAEIAATEEREEPSASLLAAIRTLPEVPFAATSARPGTVLDSKFVEHFCGRIVSAFGRAFVPDRAPRRDPRASSLKAAIDSRIDALSPQGCEWPPPWIPRLALQGLGRELNFSHSTLWHTFHGALGVSPKRYQDLRIFALACAMLESGARVSAVADQLGFNSHSYFTRWFRKFRGVAPSDWSLGELRSLGETNRGAGRSQSEVP